VLPRRSYRRHSDEETLAPGGVQAFIDRANDLAQRYGARFPPAERDEGGAA
jgi:hypothetical protein